MASRIPLYVDFEAGQIVPFDAGDTINPTYATNVGGSGSSNVGTAVVDFGSTPSSEATVVVTGQTSIGETPLMMAWIQGDSTASNSITEHLWGGVAFRCVCGSIVVGTGFTIYVYSLGGLVTGTFNINWQWL